MEKLNLKLRLKSSMVHTEESSSNVSTIYRELILKENKIHRIPALHGNSIRGLFRNLGAMFLFDKIGIDKDIDISTFHFFMSGGALNGSQVGIDILARRNIRENLPFISILGSALGNEMLQGKLAVGSLLPECIELGTGEISYHDMTNIVRMTRVDDEKLYTGDKYIKPTLEDVKTQMFYDIEVLIAGTILNFDIFLNDFTDLEKSCFYTILEEFTKKPFIGGKSSAGFGEVEFLNQFDFEKETKIYKDFLNENKEKIKQFIIDFGNSKKEAKENKDKKKVKEEINLENNLD